MRKKKQHPVSPRAGGQQEPAFPGFSPMPTQLLRVGIWRVHGEPRASCNRVSLQTCALFQSPVFQGEMGTGMHRRQPFPKSLNSLEQRGHRGIYKLWVMPSPNTQGRRQQAPPRRQESPFLHSVLFSHSNGM